MAIMIYLWFTVTSGVRETVKEKTTGSRKDVMRALCFLSAMSRANTLPRIVIPATSAIYPITPRNDLFSLMNPQKNVGETAEP